MFTIELIFAAFFMKMIGGGATFFAKPVPAQYHEPAISYGTAFVPVEGDLEIIRLEISRSMREPSSTVISNVIAINEATSSGELMTWVCGYVQGRNGFGGYVQPVPFLGSLLDTPKAGRAFITISIADADPAKQLSIFQACNSKFQLPKQ